VSIAIEDVANNFSSDEVEGALAELAASASASRLNGLLVGGGYTSSGLTLTLDTTTGVLLNGTAQDFSGASVALVNNATQFVYIDVSTATLVTSPTAPTMASEDILLWEVTTLAGVVNSGRDGRWFVFNLDRKPSLTIRSEGTAFNQTSEANFVSLEAALLYLEQYGGSAMETSRILVRGSHTITSTVSLPQNGIIFEGDGSGVFVDGTGGGDLFNLGTRNQTQFKNLLFQCNDPASRAIVSASSPDGLVVENCVFAASGDRWASAIAITGAASTSGYHRIQDSRFECYSAIEIARPLDCVIEDCTFIGSAATGALVGVNLSTAGTGAGEGRSIVRGCRLEDFATGIRDQGENGTITDCVLVNMGVLALRSAGEGATLRNVSITMDATSGISGILALGDRANIEGCRVVHLRTVWSGVTPIGIDIDVSQDSLVTGCHIEGFLDDNTFAGFGVRGTDAARLKISDTHIRNVLTGIHLTDAASVNVQITNCAIEDARFGVRSDGGLTFVTNTQITLSTVDDDRGGESGILFTDARSKVADSSIENSRRWLAGSTGQIPIGVGFSALADGGTVDNCVIEGFHNETDLTGAGVFLSAGATSIRVFNSSIEGYRGIEVSSACRTTQIQGNRVFGVIDGISVNRSATGNVANESLQISGNFVGNVSTAGIYVNGYTEVVITDNVLNGSGTTVTGIHLVGSDAAGLRVTNYAISNNTVAEMAGDAILIEDFVHSGAIAGNTIDNTLGDTSNVTANGIRLAPGTSGIRDCQIESNGIMNSIRGIYIEGTTALTADRITCNGNRIQYIGRSFAAADTFEGQGSIGIAAIYATELEISGNQISNIGRLLNADGSSYFPTGTDLASQGILLWASDRATITGNQVTRVRKVGTATARGIAIRESFTVGSPIYRHLNITGNTVDEQISVMDALILVAVDSLSGGLHTVEGCVISSNTLRGGTNSIYVNLDVESAMNKLSITGNTCEGPSVAGINVDCLGDNVTLDNVTITGNTVNRAGVAGIGVNMGVVDVGPGAVGILRNVTVTGNTIMDNVTTPVMTVGISIAALNTGAASGSTLENVNVVGNAVHAINGDGIIVNVGGDGNGSEMFGVNVSENQISQVGGFGVDIIVLYLGGGAGLAALNGLTVNANTITDPGGAGIRTSVGSSTGRVEAASYNGNVIRGAGGSGILTRILLAGTMESAQFNGNNIHTPTLTGIQFSGANGDMLNFQVNGNIIESAGVTTTDLSQGIGIVLLAGNGLTNDWQVCDNQIVQAGTTGIALGGVEVVQQATATVNFFTPGGATVGDVVTIGGTSLIGVAGVAAAGEFSIGANDPTTAENFQDAVNDTVLNPALGTIASAVRAGGIVTLTAVPVGTAGNTITLAENTGGARIAISGALLAGGTGGAGDAASMRRFQVCRNLIDRPGQTGIMVITLDGVVSSFSINENTINRPGALGAAGPSSRGGGILVGAAESLGSASFEKLVFLGNRVSWNSGDPGTQSAYGIGLLGINCNLDEVLMSDNQIDESPASGIFILMTASLASGNGKITNVDISDCNVKSNASVGVGPHYGIGIYIAASGFNLPHSSISIQGCKLRSNPNNVLGAAAAIFAFPKGSPDGTRFSQIQVSNNTFEDSDSGFLWSTLVGAGGTWNGTRPIMENIQISNNIIKDMAYWGVACIGSVASAGGASPDVNLRMEGVSITGNTFHTVGTDVTLGISAIVLRYARPWINTRVDDNTLTDCGVVSAPGFGCIDLGLGEGSSALAGDPTLGDQNLSVCRNVIHNCSAAGILIHESPLGGIASDWRNIKVNNNIIESPLNGGISVNLSDGGDHLRDFQVSHNQIDTIDVAGSGGGIFFGMGGTALVEGADISHNTINRILTGPGIWIFSAGTGVQGMTVMGNCVRTFDSHGIWFDFSAASLASSNVTVVGNSVDGDGLSTGSGFNFQLDGVGWNSLVVSGNISTDCDNGFNFNLQTGCTFQAFAVHGNIARSNTTNQVTTTATGTLTANSFQCQGNISNGAGADWTTSAVTNYVLVVGATESTNSDY